MKQVLFAFFLTIGISYFGYSQKLKIDKNIEVYKTKITSEKDSAGDRLYCFDIVNKDTITVYIIKPVLKGYNVEFKIINDNIIPKITKCTDYLAYEGKSCLELDVAKFDIEINNAVFKVGETLRMKFSITSKTNKQAKKMTFNGEIFHVLGGNKYEWRNGLSYHQKHWKNGRAVYTIQETKED